MFMPSASFPPDMGVQSVSPYGLLANSLIPVPLTGAIPGKLYTAPGLIVAVFYNGALMRPTIDYTLAGNVVTLRFSTEVLDNVYALCIA
jgi:hypothetical protein